MLGYLYRGIVRLVESAAQSRRNAYLAASVDLAELERRMRCLELDGEN
jgi:hypothetical protein